MTQEKLELVLELHKKWVSGVSGGVCANMSRSNLCNANMRDVNLCAAKMYEAKLRGADLRGADLCRANLRNADLCDAYLCDSDMCNAKLWDAYMRGTDLRNANMICADLCGADLRGADLRGAKLCNAKLCGADLRGADLRGADLRNAELCNADLRGADLHNTDLRRSDLRNANMSGAKNLLSAIDFIDTNFERTENGYIVYKTFGGTHTPPKQWEIKPGSIINEVVSSERQNDCGCGINVAPLQWVKDNYEGEIWKCIIEFPWLAGTVVPFNTDGKIRCERVKLLEIVE